MKIKVYIQNYLLEPKHIILSCNIMMLLGHRFLDG